VANHRSTETAAAINEAAAVWLLRLEASAAPELRKDFQKWLDDERRHRAAFVRLRLAWYTSEKFRLLRPADGRVDEDLITKFARSRFWRDIGKIIRK
jgi:ferric-dicitrate binding protein FerR (iron transport regulator)